RAQFALVGGGSHAVHLGDVALEAPRFQRQFLVAGLEQIGVEPDAMLDRAQRRRTNSETHALLQRLALQGDIAQIRQETALGSALGMADIIAGEHRFAGQLATTGHRTSSLSFDVLWKQLKAERQAKK